MNIESVFRCKRCGFCCQGQTTVSLDADDQNTMLATLQISREEALKLFWSDSGTQVQMKTVDGHCIFYEEGCTVHSGRPWRCRQWPLVPAILLDEKNFETIKSSCPGIVPDSLYSKICVIIKETQRNTQP